MSSCLRQGHRMHSKARRVFVKGQIASLVPPAAAGCATDKSTTRRSAAGVVLIWMTHVGAKEAQQKTARQSGSSIRMWLP